MNPTPNLPRPPGSSAKPTFSEIIPIGSAKISILRSRLLLPGIVTIVAALLLFALLPGRRNGSNLAPFVQVLGAYLVFLMFWLVYSYIASDKPVVALLFPVIAVVLLMPVVAIIGYGLGMVVPGYDSPNVIARFIAQFFGTALIEELAKAAPALVGLFLALHPARAPRWRMLQTARLRGPLDGVLFGVAAGSTFTFVETVLGYVPAIGFPLLFPRIFIAIAGHVAYAGIFGYFIGLAAIRPMALWPLLLSGWATAAALHAFWNAAGSLLLICISAGATFLLFLGCLLKARQLDGQVGQNPSGGSIVRPRGTTPGTPKPAVPTSGAPSGAQSAWAPQPSATSAFPPPPRGQAEDSLPAQAETFQLLVEGRIIPLRPGLRVDLGRLPGLAHAKGVIFAVTTHPQHPNVMGLQNLGEQPWTAIYQGSPRQVDPQRNIRVSHGTLIAFGSVQGSIQEMNS
jgi:RsiW-degrading membrane proteinase PrsW (M82 family)